MTTDKFDRVITGEDKNKKKAKKYLDIKNKIAELDAELKTIALDLIPFIEQAGEQKESGSTSMTMAGKKFTVIRSVSEKYRDGEIFDKLSELIGNDKADMAVPIFRKVNVKILQSLLTDGSVKIEDIKEFITESKRAPYIKVTDK